MRILITGGTGQVGAALIEKLRGRASLLHPARASLDLADPEAISSKLDALGPELIVNSAAFTAVDRAEDEPELAMRVNADAPGVMARWAAANDVPLIHFSTDYVFDGSGERPWREDDPVVPLSVYGKSKLGGEDQIRAAGGCFLIVRTSWVYAAHGTNFLRTIIRLARERRELRVVADQIGAPNSAALLADAVGAFLSLGQQHLRERFIEAQGLVHLAAAGETSWHGFAVAILAELRKRGVHLATEEVVPLRTVDYPTRAARPLNSRLETARFQKVFGISLPNWRDALDRECDIVAREFDFER